MPVQRTAQDVVLPSSVKDWIRLVISKEAHGDFDPIRVARAPEADAILERFGAEVGDRIKAGSGFPWNRAPEHTSKLALVVACADDIVHPQISESHARWAVNFVSGCADLTELNLSLEASPIPFSDYAARAVH